MKALFGFQLHRMKKGKSQSDRQPPFIWLFFSSVIIILWETACDTISPQSTFSGAEQTTEMFKDTATRRSHRWATVNRSKEP